MPQTKFAKTVTDGSVEISRTTAPPDADVGTSKVEIWWDPAVGVPLLKLKGKDSVGTIFNQTLSTGVGSSFARKSADQPWPSDTTFADVTDLGIAIAANGVYVFEIIVYYEGATTGDLKLSLTWPTATANWTLHGLATSATGAGGNISHIGVVRTASAGTHSAGAIGAGSVVQALIKGIILPTASGTLQLRAAQDVSDVTPTIIKANSHMLVSRVA